MAIIGRPLCLDRRNFLSCLRVIGKNLCIQRPVMYYPVREIATAVLAGVFEKPRLKGNSQHE